MRFVEDAVKIENWESGKKTKGNFFMCNGVVLGTN